MGTEGHEHAEKIKCFSEVWGVSTVWQGLFALLKNTAKFSVLCGWQEESVILVSSPPSPPTPTRVLWRWACTACREAAIPEWAPASPARLGRVGSGGCSLLIPFPPALVRVREWLSQDLQCFRARALVFTWFQCIVFSQAVPVSASV